jgi:hypothetical protein
MISRLTHVESPWELGLLAERVFIIRGPVGGKSTGIEVLQVRKWKQSLQSHPKTRCVVTLIVRTLTYN